MPSITLRPKVAFLGVNVSSSSNASAASPEIISPGPKESLEEAGFFFFLIKELDRPIVGLFIGPLSPSFSSCKSSNAMLCRKEDFLKPFLTGFEGVADPVGAIILRQPAFHDQPCS